MIVQLTFSKLPVGRDPDASWRDTIRDRAALVATWPQVVGHVEHRVLPRRRPAPFDAVTEVWFPDRSALDRPRTTQLASGAGADAVATTAEARVVVAGTPPPGAVTFLGAMQRHPSLDQPGYLEHWRSRHGPLAAAMPGLRRYLQLTPVGGAEQLHGVSLLWFDDPDALRAAFRSEAGAAVREDEPRFVDLDHSFALFLDEHPITGRPL